MTDNAALLARRAALLAVVPELDDTPEAGQAIVVAIGSERCAFALEHVVRVGVIGAITPLPHTSALVLGLGTSEGEIVAVFDGRIWCGQPARARQPRTAVIVLGSAADARALAVDAFVGTIQLAGLAPPPSATQRSWLAGITVDGILAVDVAAMLAAPDFSIGRAHSAGDPR